MLEGGIIEQHAAAEDNHRGGVAAHQFAQARGVGIDHAVYLGHADDRAAAHEGIDPREQAGVEAALHAQHRHHASYGHSGSGRARRP